MPSVSGPYLVREELAADPGTHSYNRARRAPATVPGKRRFRALRTWLLALGLAGVGYYGYTLADQNVFQAYENWSLDQQMAAHASAGAPQSAVSVQRGPLHGAILGRIIIGRLNISAVVREGVDSGTLSRAVGHVPSTALAGQPGNFSIAAHRDTLFRALKNIRAGDLVVFQSSAGTYTYRVIATQIVKPSDVSVLHADGGPRLLRQISERPARLLTMITCYPFDYIGPAPQRFIVQAEEA